MGIYRKSIDETRAGTEGGERFRTVASCRRRLVILDDAGEGSAVRPIKGTGHHAEKDQAESSHPLPFRYASALHAALMTAVPHPGRRGPEEIPACASSCP